MIRPNDETRATGKEDGRRQLINRKANYERMDEAVNVQWDQGCYRCIDQPTKADAGIGTQDKAERVFLSLMRLYRDRGIPLTANEASPKTFAPKVFFENERAKREGLAIRQLKSAVLGLLDKKALIQRQEGKGTRAKMLLEIAADA